MVLNAVRTMMGFRRRAGRALVFVLALPAMIVASSSAEVIVIHSHGEHASHHHAMTLRDLDHGHHDHPRSPDDGQRDFARADTALDDSGAFLIVPRTPITAGDSRPTAMRTTDRLCFDAAPPSDSARTAGAAFNPYGGCGSNITAPALRAERIVVGILLGNHALLL